MQADDINVGDLIMGTPREHWFARSTVLAAIDALNERPTLFGFPVVLRDDMPLNEIRIESIRVGGEPIVLTLRETATPHERSTLEGIEPKTITNDRQEEG